MRKPFGSLAPPASPIPHPASRTPHPPSLIPFVALAIITAQPSPLHAQTLTPLPIRAFEATPIGALPPVALPMPASRDQSYWGLRLQVGERRERGGPE
ncbi:MAG: hypothetical protein ACJ79I_13880, partial [Gemmatimonadaceae bacterium]